MPVEEREKQELEEAVVELRKKKFKRKIISIAIVAAIILGILVTVFFYGYNTAKNKSQKQIQELTQQLKTPIVVDTVTPEIVQNVLSTKTAEISELASAEYMFTNAAKFTASSKSWLPDWVTKKSFIQKWDGKIKAGVKLEGVEISIADKIVTISLPPAEILSYEVDYDSVEVLDEKNNVFNPITVEDKNNFDKETKAAMIERAKENGLLEKAQKNAESIIQNLLKASVENIQDYEIKFATIEK